MIGSYARPTTSPVPADPKASLRVVIPAAATSATATPSSNTVAIYALIVAAVVGIGGPLLQSLAADRRQKQALEAAKEELTTQLEAESERLDQTLSAEHRKARYESERDALDAGAVFLQRFRAKMDQSAPALDSPEMAAISEELGTQLARLRLWFAEDSQVVQAFQGMLASCAVYALDRGHGSDRLEEDIPQLRNQYLDAARAHLSVRNGGA